MFCTIFNFQTRSSSLIAGNKNYISESPRKVLTVLCTPLGWILTTVIKKKCKLI